MYILIILAFIFAALESLALWKGWRGLEFVAKPAVMVCLFIWLYATAGLQGALLWFGIGILFSLAGDIALMFIDRFFIVGLVAFLLGHVAYLIGFNIPLPPVTHTLEHRFRHRDRPGIGQGAAPYFGKPTRKGTKPAGGAGHHLWRCDHTDATGRHADTLPPGLGRNSRFTGQFRGRPVLFFRHHPGLAPLCQPHQEWPHVEHRDVSPGTDCDCGRRGNAVWKLAYPRSRIPNPGILLWRACPP